MSLLSKLGVLKNERVLFLDELTIIFGEFTCIKIILINLKTKLTMDDLKFDSTTKTKISELNLEEVRGYIIERMCQIEREIDNIILDYFNPDKKDEFKKVILNSSIITFGAKLKVLINIKSFDKNVISKIQEISSIRNAFAHLPIKIYQKISFRKKVVDDNDKYAVHKIEISKYIEVMNSAGELKTKKPADLVYKFYDLYTEVEKYLGDFNHN